MLANRYQPSTTTTQNLAMGYFTCSCVHMICRMPNTNTEYPFRSPFFFTVVLEEFFSDTFQFLSSLHFFPQHNTTNSTTSTRHRFSGSSLCQVLYNWWCLRISLALFRGPVVFQTCQKFEVFAKTVAQFLLSRLLSDHTRHRPLQMCHTRSGFDVVRHCRSHY